MVVLPTMAEHILSTCAGAQASWYPDSGHAPNLEDPTRFNHELRELVVNVSGRKDQLLGPDDTPVDRKRPRVCSAVDLDVNGAAAHRRPSC